MSDRAFTEWFKKTHGITPNSMEELNWSAQLKQAWNASKEQTVKKVIKMLEEKDCTMSSGYFYKPDFLNEIKKEFGVKDE